MKDVLPIAIIIFGMQFFVIRRPIPNVKRVIIGFIAVIVGLALFLVGLERALFPLGKLISNHVFQGVHSTYQKRQRFLIVFQVELLSTIPVDNSVNNLF